MEKTHASTSSVESTRLIKSFSIDNWHLAGTFITISQPNSYAASNFLLHLNDLVDRQSAELNTLFSVFAHCALRVTAIKSCSTKNILDKSPHLCHVIGYNQVITAFFFEICSLFFRLLLYFHRIFLNCLIRDWFNCIFTIKFFGPISIFHWISNKS